MGKTQPTLAAFAKRSATAAAAGPAAAPAIAVDDAKPSLPPPPTHAAEAKAASPSGDVAAAASDDLTATTAAGNKARVSDQATGGDAAPPATKKPKLEAKEEQDDEKGKAPAASPPPPAPATTTPTNKKTTTTTTKKSKQQPLHDDPQYAFSDADAAQFRARLLDWYDRGHRVLPWRRNPFSRLEESKDGAATTTPRPAPPESELPPQQFAYRVWVSEIMLQQTQVATVVPYFERWVQKWPTVAALAAASEEDVNSQWAGLGYYRRARFLLAGAKHVVDNLGGLFPETAEGMRAIPGVGPYTAAAVASIAFGDSSVPAAAAAVDGNVIRVVSRLRAVKGDPTKLASLHAHLAGQLLDRQRPGCHNQAMMELGATVCRPQQADCGRCPVAAFCEARRRVAAWEEEKGEGEKTAAPPPLAVTAYPEKAAKAGKREQAVAVCVLRLVKRGGGGGGGGAKCPPPPRAAAAAGSLASFVRTSTGGATAAGGEAAALASAGPAGTAYLLVQRPAQGLLAGLWECPAVVLSDEAPPPPPTKGAGGGGGGGGGAAAAAAAANNAPAVPARAARRAAVDALLSRLLGEPYRRAVAGGAGGEGGEGGGEGSSNGPPRLRVVCRRDVGSAVHVFSHIRQTMHIEVLTLEVEGSKEEAEEGGFAVSAAALFGQQEPQGEQQPAAAAPPPPRPAAKDDDDKDDADEDDEATQSDEGAAAAAAAAAGLLSAAPALRWVTGADLADAGLTTGVRKALGLATASGGGGGGAAAGGGGGDKKKKK
jgi:A/G-specific adenine glycosylase